MGSIDKTRSQLSAIKGRLENARVKWAIFAGAAAFCYGSEREITDIDILVRCEDLDKAKAALRDIDTTGFDLGCGADIPTPEGVCSFFLDQEMVEKIQWKRLLGVTVPLMSPEDNIVLKAILQRGSEQGKHDIQDIRDIIRKQKINEQYLHRRIKKCHSQKRAEPMLQTLIEASKTTG